MDITPLLTAFTIIAVAELGDKTQLAIIALSAGYNRTKVFTGVIIAFALVTGLGVLVGEALFQIVKPGLIRLIAGLLFVVFGIWILLSKPHCDTNDSTLTGSPLISAFSMITIAEMGDKTQLSVITLSAKYDSPFLVFSGAIIALALLSLIGVLAGKKLCEIVPLSKIRYGAGLMFMLSGILFLAGF